MNQPNNTLGQTKSIKLASPGKRLAAQLIDSLIFFALFFIAFKVVELFPVGKNISAFVGLAVGGAYYLLSDAMPRGQSVGKRLMRIAVVSDFGYTNCSLFQSALRNITTPFLGVIDWVFMFFGSRKRLGDMLASTLVINA